MPLLHPPEQHGERREGGCFIQHVLPDSLILYLTEGCAIVSPIRSWIMWPSWSRWRGATYIVGWDTVACAVPIISLWMLRRIYAAKNDYMLRTNRPLKIEMERKHWLSVTVSSGKPALLKKKSHYGWFGNCFCLIYSIFLLKDTVGPKLLNQTWLLAEMYQKDTTGPIKDHQSQGRL